MWTEPILHVDMDAFFVEVERLDNPNLRGRPVAVGGTGGRGVIASASYEARKFGVRSAQPTAIAMGLCRDLVVVSPAHHRYSEVSAAVFAVFRTFTPLVEGLSLDEAFLDVTGLRRHFESSVAVGSEVRARIREELGLPASVGVASTKFLAKLASEVAKPNGMKHIPVETQLDFLHVLPVESLWGVGPATLAGLQRLGIITVGDLATVPVATLQNSLGPTQGAHLLQLANGVDPRPVLSASDTKSISVEETYEHDIKGRDMVEAALMAHSQRLASRLRRAGLAARTLTLKVRFSDFTTVTRSHTHPTGLSEPREIYKASLVLLDQVKSQAPVRLLGVAGSGFDPEAAPRQISFESDDAWHRVAEAVASAEDKFGPGTVEPARILQIKPEPGDDAIN